MLFFPSLVRKGVQSTVLHWKFQLCTTITTNCASVPLLRLWPFEMYVLNSLLWVCLWAIISDTCISPVCLCRPTQQGGLLPTVERSSFNIPAFLVPWRRFWVLERKSNNDSLYWQTRPNRYHMSEKVFLQAFTWMLSDWVHKSVLDDMKSPPYIFH